MGQSERADDRPSPRRDQRWSEWAKANAACNVDGKGNAILRFYGRTKFKPGFWCGVELTEAEGKHDGAKGGKRYFKCSDGCGVFVHPDKVVVLVEDFLPWSGVTEKKRMSRQNSAPATFAGAKPSAKAAFNKVRVSVSSARAFRRGASAGSLPSSSPSSAAAAGNKGARQSSAGAGDSAGSSRAGTPTSGRASRRSCNSAGSSRAGTPTSGRVSRRSSSTGSTSATAAKTPDGGVTLATTTTARPRRAASRKQSAAGTTDGGTVANGTKAKAKPKQCKQAAAKGKGAGVGHASSPSPSSAKAKPKPKTKTETAGTTSKQRQSQTSGPPAVPAAPFGGEDGVDAVSSVLAPAVQVPAAQHVVVVDVPPSAGPEAAAPPRAAAIVQHLPPAVPLTAGVVVRPSSHNHTTLQPSEGLLPAPLAFAEASASNAGVPEPLQATSAVSGALGMPPAPSAFGGLPAGEQHNMISSSSSSSSTFGTTPSTPGATQQPPAAVATAATERPPAQPKVLAESPGAVAAVAVPTSSVHNPALPPPEAVAATEAETTGTEKPATASLPVVPAEPPVVPSSSSREDQKPAAQAASKPVFNPLQPLGTADVVNTQLFWVPCKAIAASVQPQQRQGFRSSFSLSNARGLPVPAKSRPRKNEAVA